MMRMMRPGMLSLTSPMVTERFMVPPCGQVNAEAVTY